MPASEPLSIYVAVGTYRPLYSAEDGHYTTDGSVKNSFVLVPHVQQLYGGFTANSAAGNGGAVDFYRSPAPQLDYAVITGNWAQHFGGGLNSSESGLLVKNSLFFRNEAVNVGGAVLRDEASLLNVTMVDNHGQLVPTGRVLQPLSTEETT